MANLRPILFMGLLVLSYLMWVEWQKDYGPRPQPQPVAETQTPSFDEPPLSRSIDDSVPSIGDLPKPETANTGLDPETGTQAVMTGENELLKVTTDVLDIGIDLTGGTVVKARFLKYPVDLEVTEIKVDLLNRSGPEMFIAQSGLLSREAAPNHTSVYRSERMQYSLGESTDEIRVPLTWVDDSGIRVTKTFIFQRGKYDITVRHTVTNDSGQTGKVLHHNA